MQQVLLTVLEAVRAGRVENLERLDAFVLGTCRKMSWDMRRTSARQQRVAQEAAAGMPEGWEPSWPEVDRARLEGCLQRLEQRDRAVVLMTFSEEQSADEIGRRLEVSAGNVRVIRHRALARLHACVEGIA